MTTVEELRSGLLWSTKIDMLVAKGSLAEIQGALDSLSSLAPSVAVAVNKLRITDALHNMIVALNLTEETDDMRDVTEESKPIHSLSTGGLNALVEHSLDELFLLVEQAHVDCPDNGAASRKEQLDEIIALAEKARMYNGLVYDRDRMKAGQSEQPKEPTVGRGGQ